MRRILRFLIPLLGLFGALQARAQTPVPLPVQGNLGSISGSGVPYAGIDIQLQNCPSPVSITGYWGIIQQEYQVMADPSGNINTTVWPNDLITCNGTTGNSQYNLSLILNGVVQGTPQCYQVVSTQVLWNLTTQQPIACSQPAPNPQDKTFRNLTVTGFFQGNNGAFSGTLDVGAMNMPGPVINVLREGVVAGGTLGGSLPTDTTNTAAINAAIATAAAAHGELYFPCGVYNFNSCLTAYTGYNGFKIKGGGNACTVLQFTGASPLSCGGLTIAYDAPSTPCTSVSCLNNPSGSYFSFSMEDIAIIGNSNLPDDLDMLSGAQFYLNNVTLIGAGTTDYYCNGCQQGQINNLNTNYNALYGYSGFQSYQTPNGIKLDNSANKIKFDTPVTDYMTGKAIWLTGNSGANTFINCQNSTNLYGITIDAGSNDNQFINCQNEDGGTGSTHNTSIIAGSYNTFENVDSSGPTTVTSGAIGNKFKGGGMGTLTLASGSKATQIEGVDISPLGVTDNATDTTYINNLDPVSSQIWAQYVPAIQTAPGSLGGRCSGFLHLEGNWSTTGTASNLTPTTLCGVGSGWRAVFKGYWIAPTGYVNLPQMLEFTTANPTQSLGTGAVTIAAANAGHLTMATTSAGGTVYFTGSVDFYPDTGTNSATFASPIAAPSLALNSGTAMTDNQGNGTKIQHSTGSTTTNHCVKFDANGNTVDAGATCSAAPAYSIVAVWNGASGALVDDGEGGSGYESGALSWGVTITGTYYVDCFTTGWTGGSTIGRRNIATTVGIPLSGTTFSYGIDVPTIAAARGNTIPSVTCTAIQ